MSDPIATLLTRNLFEVFGVADPHRRRAAIAALYADDAIFTDHDGQFQGHEALDRQVAALHQRFPGWVFQPGGAPQILRPAGRLAWGFGPPGESPRVTGMDVAVVQEGKIAALYAFLDG